MIPTWLANTLGDTHRSARLRRCTRCGAPILAGLDAPRAALPVRADPTPLTAVGETVALLNRRATFDLIDAGGRKELNWRDSMAISGTRRYPVLAEHACGVSLADFAEAIPVCARYLIPDSPPF